MRQELKKGIEEVLRDIYPIWCKRQLRDQRRTIRRQGAGRGDINLEPYSGARTAATFQREISGRLSIGTFDECLRKHQPLMLGYLINENSARLIQDCTPWINVWCSYLDAHNASTNFDVALNALLVDLESLVGGEAVCVTTFFIIGLALPSSSRNIVLHPGDDRLGVVYLHSLTEEEFTEATASDSTFGPSFDLGFTSDVAALVHRTPTTIKFQPVVDLPLALQGSSPTSDEIGRARQLGIRSLHLIKPGSVDVWYATTAFEPAVAPNGITRTGWPTPSFSMKSFVLDEGEVPTLKERFERLINCRPEIAVAAGRLVDAEARSNAADAILDAAIGLETLLNPTARDELTFRVRLNYAFLGDIKERRMRVDDLKELYNYRGKIVHGGLNHERDRTRIDEVAARGRENLRDTITRFLRDPLLHSEAKLDADFWLDRILGPP